MDELLFQKGDLAASLEHQSALLAQAVEGVPEDHFRQVDEAAWISVLVEQFRAGSPVLALDRVYREPAEDVRVDVSSDPGRYFSDYVTDRTVAGCRVVVRIPFSGDGAVFGLKPNSFSFNPPRGRVLKQELLLTLTYANNASIDVDSRRRIRLHGPAVARLGACSDRPIQRTTRRRCARRDRASAIENHQAGP